MEYKVKNCGGCPLSVYIDNDLKCFHPGVSCNAFVDQVELPTWCPLRVEEFKVKIAGTSGEAPGFNEFE